MEDLQDHNEQSTGSQSNSTPKLPPPPEPENDTGIIPSITSPSNEEVNVSPENVDIFTLQPVVALRMLCRSIDTLVRLTGDIPPTPPVRSRGTSPNQGTPTRRSGTMGDSGSMGGTTTPGKENTNLATPRGHQDQIDGVPFIKTPIGSPEAQLNEPSHVIGAHAQPVHLQHGAIARKFYSKRPPPISTEDYLMRMHKYCPMSTAVYLATSTYINRMAIQDRLLPVTPRNVHRLLLAGLRVAMKALEDLSWPHSRFSKVGGVSEIELGKLEITFCFLMDFTLKVDAEMLKREAENLARQMPGEELGPEGNDHQNPSGSTSVDGTVNSPIPTGHSGGMNLNIPDESTRRERKGGEKRKASSALPSRPVMPQMGSGIEVLGQS